MKTNYKHLTEGQRYEIYCGLVQGKTKKEIAASIGVHPSTVSREIKRHGSGNGYNPAKAIKEAEKTAHRPSNRKLKPEIRMMVVDLLEKGWSPRQISGRLKITHGISVSHETIYKMIRADETGVLASYCRHKMKYIHHKVKRLAKNIPDRVSIHDRPKEADGTRFGDWEMDTIVGPENRGAILTLTERSTNFILAARLPKGKNAEALAKVVYRLLLPYKGDGVKTITTDNGSEFAAHKEVARKLRTTVYFADPYASWQKGAIENANKLIRQYIPKGTDLNTVSDKKIAGIQKKLNERPREKLKFSLPKVEFFKHFS